VVQTLLDTFVETSVGVGATDTANAQSFLAQQVAEYERRLSESEQKLAQFKKENVGLMPDQRGDYFVRLQSAIATADKVRTDLAVAERQRDSLRRKISGESAEGPAVSAAPPTALEVQEATVLDSRIREVRRQLSDLLVKYTDKHPEVVAVRTNLQSLEAQRRGDMRGVAATNGSANANDKNSAPVDPVIQNLQIAYNAADVQVAALQTQQAQANSSVAELRRLVTTGPEVEAELSRLNRDYGVTKAQYEALLQRFENARLSSDATRSEELRFKTLESPKAALTPVSPNRPLLLAAVLAASAIAGFGLVIGLSLLQPVFLSRKSVSTALGLPVIGVVRLARSPEQRNQMSREQWVLVASAAALVGVIIVLAISNYPISQILGRLFRPEAA
jgi:polysaccharide chain length determinant protein (PEP-CTERM system associated)